MSSRMEPPAESMKATLMLRSSAGILAVITVASAAATASASTIITSCGKGFDVCAVSPEAATTRTLIARNPAENSRADMGTISRDGSTFGAVVGGQAPGQPFRWRVVTAPTSIGAPVGSSQDTATLRDLAPPEPQRFWALSLGDDGRNATYARSVSFTEAPGSGGFLRDLHWVRDGVDGLVGRLPVNFVAMAGNRPLYKRSTELCEIVPGNPCQVAYTGAANESFTVSPDGRRLLIGRFAKAPGEMEIADGVAVGRASTIDVVDIATRRTARRLAGATNGVWSADGRQLAYADVSDGTYKMVIAPADGSLQPRRVGSGLPKAWGGPVPPAGPPVSAPASVRRSSLGRGVRVVVRSVTKGRRVRIVLAAGGRTLRSVTVTASGRSFSRRLRLSTSARRRAAKARKLTVRVTVGALTTAETVRVR